MKKLLLFTAVLFIATTFTACFGGDTESSSMSPEISTSPSPIASSSPSSMSSMEDMNYQSLDAYFNAVKEEYADKYIPDKMLSDPQIKDEIGLSPENYEEVLAEISTMSENPDRLIAVKTKPNMATKVVDELKAHKEALLVNNEYSANTEKIEASEIYSNGDFVFMILLGSNEFGNGSDMATNFKDETKKGIDTLKNMFAE